MGHTANSILIQAPYDLVFDISNDIPRWTELFGGEYTDARIVQREGNRITFQLTDRDGNSWQSFRLLFKEDCFTYAQKKEPAFPFQWMKIIWLYTPRPDGILMTWIQDFTMDGKAKYSDEQVEGFINQHSQDNLRIFKAAIEKEAAG